MTERDFVIRYVLARAGSHHGGMGGYEAAQEARKAWIVIEGCEDVSGDVPPPPPPDTPIQRGN